MKGSSGSGLSLSSSGSGIVPQSVSSLHLLAPASTRYFSFFGKVATINMLVLTSPKKSYRRLNMENMECLCLETLVFPTTYHFSW